MAEKFLIRPGIYLIPGYGKADLTKKTKQDELVKIYLNKKSRPFIKLLSDGLPLLKKQDLSDKQIAELITWAGSIEEINLLRKLSKKDAIQRIADNKINNFHM